MNITLRLNLMKRKPDKDGLCPLAVSIRGDGREVFYYPGVKIPPENWRDGAITKGVKNHDVLNGKLRRSLADVERKIMLAADAGETLTLEDVKAMFRPDAERVSGDFHAYHLQYISVLATRHSEGYIKHRKVEYRKFKEYTDKKLGRPLRFTDVSDALLEDYEASLTCMPTTKHTKMKRIKEVVDRAVDQGKVLREKVATYKLPPYVTPDALYLTLADLDKIQDGLDKGKLAYSKNLVKVACYFLIECCAGIRFSDWSRFRIETLLEGRHLRVRARKNKEPVYIPLDRSPRLAAIIDYVTQHKIVFDLKERETNLLLRTLGARLELSIVDDLTTHVGRHTCGTILGAMRYTTREIADVLGISEKTAKTYISTTRQGVQGAFERLGGI